MNAPVIKEFSAVGQTSAEVVLAGYFNISVGGAFTATVVLERSFDKGQHWGTVATYTSVAEAEGHDQEGAIYRFRCTAYTSGTPWVRLGQ